MKTLYKKIKIILEWSIYLQLIVSIGYVIYTFVIEHILHGHYNLQDPEHIIGIAAVIIGAYLTWRKRTMSKRRSLERLSEDS